MLHRDDPLAGPPAFHVGDLYSSAEIQAELQVGNAGGIRVSLQADSSVRRMVVLTSVPSGKQAAENPYHDRIEGEFLIYTGAGRTGDQTLAGINKRIPEQLENDFPIYGFQLIGSRRDKSIGAKRWKFLGLLEYVRHYPEVQLDTERQMRHVWVFELFIHLNPSSVVVSQDREQARELLGARKVLNAIASDEREVIIESADAQLRDDHERSLNAEMERRRLLATPAEEFEQIVKVTLHAAGFEKVCVTRFSQDGGIDVNAFAGMNMWPVRGLLLQVQAKRWLHTVGRREVAELRGSLQPFARGAVVTTSHFSRAAIAEATEVGKNPIVLIDGYSFARTVLDLGVRNTSVSATR